MNLDIYNFEQSTVIEELSLLDTTCSVGLEKYAVKQLEVNAVAINLEEFGESINNA